MKPDYYANLGQQAFKQKSGQINFDDKDVVTTTYHVRVAEKKKDTEGNKLRNDWAEKRLKVQLELFSQFIHQPPSLDLSLLPVGTVTLQFELELVKPYISRDDNPFYIVDNPIVRDKVFQLPMVRPTAWKGAMRHALWQLGHEKTEYQIERLFGTANEKEPQDGKRGRLYFYPTFFTKIGLEIINPHERERRIGKNPILIECVPAGATGAFTLLYTPLDRIGKDRANTKREAFTDLALVAEGIEAMLTTYGFGAKTSSGYGLADLKGKGELHLHYPDSGDQLEKPTEPTQPAELAGFLQEYPNETFSDKPVAWRKKHNASKSKQNQYRDAKAKWNNYEKEVVNYQTQLTEWETAQQTSPPAITKRPFTDWDELQTTISTLPGGAP